MAKGDEEVAVGRVGKEAKEREDIILELGKTNRQTNKQEQTR